MDDPLLTVAEIAARLKLNPQTVRRWLKSGRLKGISMGSDRAGWRMRASEVEAFLTRGASLIDRAEMTNAESAEFDREVAEIGEKLRDSRPTET